MISNRNILFVTGTRADFSKLEPLAKAAKKLNFKVSFFVTGMHMMEKYGLTKVEVHNSSDNWGVAEFVNQRDGDPQDIVLAKTIMGFSDFVQESRPDLVVVHGDRIEAIACALVCSTNYIRCAHVEGGEVSGTIDEVFRHCNTKLSSVHLVSSDTAAARIKNMGESKERIYVIGSPELDEHHKPSGVTIEQVKERYEIAFSSYGIAVFHPVTSEQDSIKTQAESLFSALDKSGKNFVVIMPNNDPGSKEILDVINKLPMDRFRIIPSMRFNYFSELLKKSKAVIGNSSVGVREAPFLGVPSLDIGSRQNNRSDAPSVFNCLALDSCKINSFIEQYWGKSFDKYVGFGTGLAADNFASIVNNAEFWQLPMQKFFTDVVSPEL